MGAVGGCLDSCTRCSAMFARPSLPSAHGFAARPLDRPGREGLAPRLGLTLLCSPDIIDMMNYARPSPFFSAPNISTSMYPCQSRPQS